jgi:hypothetical protein
LALLNRFGLAGVNVDCLNHRLQPVVVEFENMYKGNKDFNLRGIGWWSYVNQPYGFPQGWPVLGEMFEVIKV